MESFGQYIRTLRVKEDFTLNELATKLEIDPANLSKIETGKREFDIKRLTKLCNVFKLNKVDTLKELLSERIAKSICENELDESVLSLANEKISSMKFNGFEYENDQDLSVVLEPNLFGESDWRLKEFSNPNAEIRIGTLFSGIGAI